MVGGTPGEGLPFWAVLDFWCNSEDEIGWTWIKGIAVDTVPVP